MIWNVLVQIYDLAWFTAVLVLLFMIWRQTVRNSQSVIKALIDVAMKDSEMTRATLQLTQQLLEHIQQLLEQLKDTKKTL